MATCTPIQPAKSNQSTLFSFMKKKDPNDVADTQKYLNFVTPVVENVETSVDQNGNDENGRVHDGMDSSEPNPDIDRLVCCSDNSSKSNRLPSSPVVDLTNDDAAPNQQKTKANVVSASKKRKSPVNKSKAAPAAPTKSISEAFAAAKEISNALSPSKLGPVVVTDVCGNDVVQLEECPAPTVTAESTIAPLDAPVDVPAAPAKKDATTKKRTRKPSVKKTEAVESAALDAPTEGEAGEGHAAVDSKADAADDKEEKQDQTAKPAAKRRRKPTTTPAKAVPVSIVYPPHVEVKLQSNREKLSNLVAELGKLESCVDYQDSELEIAQAVDAVLAAAENLPYDTVASPETPTQTVTAPDAATMETDGTPEKTDEQMAADAEPMAVEQDYTPSPVAAATPAGADAPDSADAPDAVPTEVCVEGTPSAVPSVPEVAAPPAVLTAEDRAKVHVMSLIRAVIARCVQGKSTPLRDIVAATLQVLGALQQKLSVLPAKEPTTQDAAQVPAQDAASMELKADEVATVPELDALQSVSAAVVKFQDATVLSEEIKSIAVRHCYGNRADKTSMFDCTDSLSVWRWEAHSFQHFSKASQSIIREARTVRGRYSRALRAVFRVLEQQSKQPYSEAKVAPLEEKAVKALAEVEKAKEKRRELEAKRLADAEEKRRREELKEQKRLEKEEARRVAAEAAAAAKAAQAPVEKEKKTPVVNEKAQRKAAELEKSKNVFMSFLKSSNPASTSTPKAAAAPASASSSSAGASCTPATQSSPSTSDEEKLARFEAAMKSEMAMSDIMKYQRQRYQDRPRTRKNRRPSHIELHVTVIVPDPRARSAFDATDNTYSEIQEKRFHNKIRTLAFHEDHRPAYVGTVSRTSRVISGRRPLARDTELLNYEYDSEEDWEEEVEGEDLNETDEEGEEEEGGNELEYDDFFCRDDDYGSDAEGDMVGVPLKVCPKNVIEVFGPRFINPAVLPALVVDPTKENVITRRGDEPISTFTIFDLATRELVSRPARQDADSNNLSMYTAVSYSTHSAPVLGQFETKKASQSGGAAANNAEQAADAKPAPAPKGFDESKLLDLVKHIHGKKEGVDKLVASFHELHPTISKLQIQKRIKDITEKTKHADGYGTMRFIVKPDVLESLSLTMADLDEVIFTPQKKQKKRTAATLIASSLEDLKTQLGVDGTPSFPQLAARAPISAALSKVVPMSVAPQNPTPAPVASASGTTTGSALSAAAAVGAATVTSGSSPASSVKATVTKHTSSTVSASDDSAKKGIKRKSDADPSVPKSAKKPPTAPKMAAVTPAASASLKPISSIFSKKITSFLVSQSPSAPSAQEAVQSSPQAKDVSTIESPKSQVIEIDME